MAYCSFGILWKSSFGLEAVRALTKPSVVMYFPSASDSANLKKDRLASAVIDGGCSDPTSTVFAASIVPVTVLLILAQKRPEERRNE